LAVTAASCSTTPSTYSVDQDLRLIAFIMVNFHSRNIKLNQTIMYFSD
jgi:hypothetical protein